MAKIQWDNQGERRYEIGLDRGVLYLDGQEGVPWNGIVSVDEKSSGGSQTAYYVDGQKFLNVSAPEEFAATLNAYTYPDEFMACDGTLPVDNGLFIKNQPRKSFGLSYRTNIGNDVVGNEYAYRLHIIYGVLAAPSQQQNESMSDSPTPSTFSWDLTALPPLVSGFRPSAHIMIDTRIAHPGAVSDTENLLYGTLSAPSRLPTIAELVEIFEENATLRITDNGDGTWTATAADDTGIISVNADSWTKVVIENFDDNTIDGSIWDTTGTGATASGGKLQLPANDTYPGLISLDTFNLNDGFIAIQYNGSGTPATYTDLYLGFGDVYGNAVYLFYNVDTQTWGIDHHNDATVGDFAESSSLTLADGDWFGLGLVDDDNVVHCYHSADGIAWTLFHTFPITGTIIEDPATFRVSSGDSLSSATYTFAIDSPSYVIPNPAGTEFSITWDSAIITGDTTYTITSL